MPASKILLLPAICFALAGSEALGVVGPRVEVRENVIERAGVGQDETESSPFDPAARRVVEQLRATYRSAAGIRVTSSGSTTGPDGRLEFMQTQTILSISGDLKVLSPTRNLTYRGGIIYADSPFFPGYVIRAMYDRVPDGPLIALEKSWPIESLPLPARIRMAAGVETIFKPWLELIGEAGTVRAGSTAWPDGTAAQTLRFRSADGETRILVWIDLTTGFIRGIRGRIATDAGIERFEIAHDTVSSDRRPSIVVATVNRTVVDSFEQLLKRWRAVHLVPPFLGE